MLSTSCRITHVFGLCSHLTDVELHVTTYRYFVGRRPWVSKPKSTTYRCTWSSTNTSIGTHLLQIHPDDYHIYVVRLAWGSEGVDGMYQHDML